LYIRAAAEQHHEDSTEENKLKYNFLIGSFAFDKFLLINFLNDDGRRRLFKFLGFVGVELKVHKHEIILNF
jgi:hypothetical protein